VSRFTLNEDRVGEVRNPGRPWSNTHRLSPIEDGRSTAESLLYLVVDERWTDGCSAGNGPWTRGGGETGDLTPLPWLGSWEVAGGSSFPFLVLSSPTPTPSPTDTHSHTHSHSHMHRSRPAKRCVSLRPPLSLALFACFCTSRGPRNQLLAVYPLPVGSKKFAPSLTSMSTLTLRRCLPTSESIVS
jgi:hypothetical protein